ncbi:protein translocase subunit SecF [Megalodesulfovibrio gigas]|uniref:Protein-export membrane protein SecF n=1 Tax=Megalodesulfovibrio gigas (strain ATCC 19364 / DSM 1382 / NCIMB 9332 / VKM B-1759) TaxID=1121448 RepID=T2GEW0_MEGG1|nr:protein translocase subunit SecF [Megalodesulfovibrio gigas]AGW14467.1 putative protein-export membrane protein SecF [Megalodesulfovibrio gigas DSM 1382 = ATCC 19364]
MGLSFFKQEPKIDFVGARFICLGLSALLLLVGLASLALKGGPRYGIDFAGGLMIQAKFEKAPDVEAIKKVLDSLGLPGLVVQSFGQEGDNEVLIRSGQTELTTDAVKTQIDQALAGLDNAHEVQRVEMVGPKVGADLRNKAMEAMFYAVLLISMYISGRFEQRWWAAGAMAGGLMATVYVFHQFGIPTGGLTVLLIAVSMVLCLYLKLNYALGAVVALVHDVIITIGIFSLLDKEFDLTTIAALLTIIGYSLNDTIIVFDRIRENLKAMKGEPLATVINKSANQTLSRTILTSGTTLLVVACLYFFGGGVIHDFALALLVGIGVGTYSSIFIAAAILLALKPKADAPTEQPA